MASQNSLILREANVRDRLKAELDRARENGANIPEPVFTHRDRDVARVQELEFFADVVEALLPAKPEPVVEVKAFVSDNGASTGPPISDPKVLEAAEPQEQLQAMAETSKQAAETVVDDAKTAAAKPAHKKPGPKPKGK